MEPLKVNAKIESIRENIRKGKIKESLDELNQIITEVQDTGLENDFLYLSASFHSKEREINLNLTNNKEEWNKIIYAIIQLMYAVKEATLKGEILVATTSLKAVVRPTGYCIRTGKKIPFNISKPLSPAAYETWILFEDVYYPEKFCHFTGEQSNGETCFITPILKKNWKKAREVHGF